MTSIHRAAKRPNTAWDREPPMTSPRHTLIVPAVLPVSWSGRLVHQSFGQARLTSATPSRP